MVITPTVPFIQHVSEISTLYYLCCNRFPTGFDFCDYVCFYLNQYIIKRALNSRADIKSLEIAAFFTL